MVRANIGRAALSGSGAVGSYETDNERTVLLVASPEGREALRARWNAIADAWPAPFEAPICVEVDLQELGNRGDDPNVRAVILASGGDDSQAAVFQALDRLGELLMPTVLEVPTSEAGTAIGGAHPERELVMLTADADPGTVASILEGMMRRQLVVRRLESELQLARRFQGGLRGEIDKIHEELQLAASVQREFLPSKIPTIDNLDVQVLFRPCGYVSGDIYDVQRLDDDHLSLFIADAVGHGVPAALMTMVLCRCLTTKLNEGGTEEILSPAEVLRSMNHDLIRRHGDTPRFATAVYAIINGQTREVRIAGAGHPHPLRLKPNGACQTVPTEGGLLGIFPEDSFEEVRFTLDPDEMLVLFSDGFETAFPTPKADEYGRRVPNQHYVGRFSKVADQWRSQGLPGAMRTLHQGIDEQVGSLHQVDDLTAILAVPRVETALESMVEAAERHLRGS